jgi:hypothetical protein
MPPNLTDDRHSLRFAFDGDFAAAGFIALRA